MKALELKQNEEEDNVCSTSRDSIKAIPPSDMEHLETDLEDNLNTVKVPFIEEFMDESIAMVGDNKGEQKEEDNRNDVNLCIKQPVINSQTLFVEGDRNMIINNFNDNFNVNEDRVQNVTDIGNLPLNCRRMSRNKDLERRKLSQNLDNFSLRLEQRQLQQKHMNPDHEQTSPNGRSEERNIQENGGQMNSMLQTESNEKQHSTALSLSAGEDKNNSNNT